jgi:hypothetical protein
VSQQPAQAGHLWTFAETSIAWPITGSAGFSRLPVPAHEGWPEETTDYQGTDDEDPEGKVNGHLLRKNAERGESKYSQKNHREKKASPKHLHQCPHV